MTTSSKLILPAATVEVVASVAEHRLLSTAQIHAMHFPASRVRWAQRVLARLESAGYLAKVRTQHAPRLLWFLTEQGAGLLQETGALSESPKVFNADAALGQLRRHTLAVNDAAICFLAAARERGDEFGPFSWRHEVSHPLGPSRGRLIADVVLTYLAVEEEGLSVEQRFLELDRATLAVDRLASQLARYAELFRASGRGGEPLWSDLYPAFPTVLCVLTGAHRKALERRRATAIALLASKSALVRTPQVEILICLLEDLQARGPFAPIFRSPRDPVRGFDWRRGNREADR
jgi:hypothetical protein